MLIRDGKACWAKVVGAPKPGYDKTKKEWSFDLSLKGATIDGQDAAKALRKIGLGRFIKDKADDRGEFIHLKRKAVKADGKDAQPIRIVDAHNNDWDGRLIGNGSTLNVSVAVNENPGAGGKLQMFMSPLSIQVWDLTKYQPKSEFPTKEHETSEETAATDKKDW